MKERISASVEKETINRINKLLKKGRFRNKSHVIEEAIKLLEESEGSNEK
ncbi:MAG: ribbon-helix-helix domain-containing protein [Nanoarchaeota archaeon]|nr:ribbon-helix-helix domain-containing protein [Nanoarchaeota archaeon]